MHSNTIILTYSTTQMQLKCPLCVAYVCWWQIHAHFCCTCVLLLFVVLTPQTHLKTHDLHVYAYTFLYMQHTWVLNVTYAYSHTTVQLNTFIHCHRFTKFFSILKFEARVSPNIAGQHICTLFSGKNVASSKCSFHFSKIQKKVH